MQNRDKLMLRTVCRLMVLTALVRVPSIWLYANNQNSKNQISIGRTHFILDGVTPPVNKTETSGADVTKSSDNQASKANSSSHTSFNNVCKKVVFSPRHDVQELLLDLINQEQERIAAAVYFFTDDALAEALKNALDRKITVEVIIDPGCLQARNNRAGFLADNGVPVFVYNPERGGEVGGSLMHHKFAYFGKNIGGGPLVFTGSYNWTRTARESNRENGIILADERVDEYLKEFEGLKKVSYRYEAPPKSADRKKKDSFIKIEKSDKPEDKDASNKKDKDEQKDENKGKNKSENKSNNKKNNRWTKEKES